MKAKCKHGAPWWWDGCLGCANVEPPDPHAFARMLEREMDARERWWRENGGEYMEMLFGDGTEMGPKP